MLKFAGEILHAHCTVHVRTTVGIQLTVTQTVSVT